MIEIPTRISTLPQHSRPQIAAWSGGPSAPFPPSSSNPDSRSPWSRHRQSPSPTNSDDDSTTVFTLSLTHSPWSTSSSSSSLPPWPMPSSRDNSIIHTRSTTFWIRISYFQKKLSLITYQSSRFFSSSTWLNFANQISKFSTLTKVFSVQLHKCLQGVVGNSYGAMGGISRNLLWQKPHPRADADFSTSQKRSFKVASIEVETS